MGSKSSSISNNHTSSEAYDNPQEELSQSYESVRGMSGSDSGSSTENNVYLKCFSYGDRAKQMQHIRRLDRGKYLERRQETGYDRDLFREIPHTKAYKNHKPSHEKVETSNEVNEELLFKQCRITSGDLKGLLVTVIGLTSRKASVVLPDGEATTVSPKILKEHFPCSNAERA